MSYPASPKQGWAGSTKKKKTKTRICTKGTHWQILGAEARTLAWGTCKSRCFLFADTKPGVLCSLSLSLSLILDVAPGRTCPARTGKLSSSQQESRLNSDCMDRNRPGCGLYAMSKVAMFHKARLANNPVGIIAPFRWPLLRPGSNHCVAVVHTSSNPTVSRGLTRRQCKSHEMTIFGHFGPSIGVLSSNISCNSDVCSSNGEIAKVRPKRLP